ncbi:unnamed protein product, partial [Mesorhabditis belari]|uniref:G-protein coupled receptors family 1 profile domain-containing protein n=1 Tax=Mesorhabditis belari TaxID=2138241 RepID=A0AAF3J9Q3_9BILA
MDELSDSEMLDEIAPECLPWIDVRSDPTTHPLSVAACIVLYSFVFVLGLVGNLGVIVATLRYRSLQTVQNIFIVNLAVADVILCILSIPLTPVTHIFKQWYFGEVLCKIFGAMQAIGVFIGTFFLCAIAVDRYFRLVGAPGRPLRKQDALRITVSLWWWSTGCTIPYAYHMSLHSYDRICGQFCTEKWSSETIRIYYTIFVLVIQFIVPFTIMTICYHSIFAFLRRRAANRLTSIGQQANLLYVLAATAGGDSQQHKEQLSHLIDQKKRVIAQKRRVTIILVSMVAIFGVTSLPHNVVSMLLEHDQTILTVGDTDYQYIASMVTHFLAMLSCVANPLLYAFLNPEFRELIVSSLRWTPYVVVSRSWQPTQTSIL